MTKRFSVTKRFAETFNLVCEHYGCTPAEIKLMKAAVKLDGVESAEVCFDALRREIEGATGSNERIRAFFAASSFGDAV